jgi:serine/threonine protein kinase
MRLFLFTKFSLLSLVDLQQLKLIIELLGTPAKDFFNPTCHFCILTQNLMTGEKFVRSLPYVRKKNFRRAFDECDDDEALDFLEKLLILEPLDRIDTREALEHPYFKKYPKNDTENNIPAKFDEDFDGNNWIDMIRRNVAVQD